MVCAAVFLAGLFVTYTVYEGVPHIEDEIAYAWQARAIASGLLVVPSPEPNSSSFLVPFVVDYQGQRFGKYPVGWPAVLAIGERLGIRAWINPLLTGLAFWFMYRLIKKVLDEPTALLAVMLGSVSPFVLVNAGTLLSHPWSLFLTVVFSLSWLDAFSQENPLLPAGTSRWLPTLTAGLSLGLLCLTRPMTAAAIAAPCALHALVLITRKRQGKTAFRLVAFCLAAGGIASLYLLWQYAVTGNFFLNPYTLWWPYDRAGFGPGIGLQPGGFSVADAAANTLASLYTGNTDLFGWPVISWLFLPFGCIACRRSPRAWLIALVPISIVMAYAFYWTHTQVFGPRYYFEALPGVLMLSAAGLRWLAGFQVGSSGGNPWNGAARLRFLLAGCTAGVLVAGNLIFYLPARLRGLEKLNGISQECILPIQDLADEQSRPVLVIIHPQTSFNEYACSLDLNHPVGDGRILTAISRGEEIDRTVEEYDTERDVFHYFPATGEFTRVP